MSDGPFKNLNLTKLWKKFAIAVQNDACGRAECLGFASDALLRDILTANVEHLLLDLQAYASREQLGLDVRLAIEKIFDSYSKTPFIDTLQKEIALRLNEQISSSEAIKQALAAAVAEQISIVKNRIEDECVCAHDFRGMWPEEFCRAVNESNAILDALAINEICEAILGRDKDFYKSAVSKKQGIEEGPYL